VSTFSLRAADEAPKETKDKISYSIGISIGGNLKRQGVDVNDAMLINGIKDALSGAKPKLTDEDMGNIAAYTASRN